MAFYECTFVARADLGKGDVQKLTDALSKIVTDNGGTIVKAEYWGLRTLAYKINKMSKGHYTLLGLDCPGAGPQGARAQHGHQRGHHPHPDGPRRVDGRHAHRHDAEQIRRQPTKRPKTEFTKSRGDEITKRKRMAIFS
ncbi:MAG: 30S ribosomal protein S6 [Alphaproteobacteria bacterium]